MSNAAPAAGADAEAKAEQAEASEKKPLLQRLRRPPKGLFLTLLGIALTAWLLPAVTRQWDDRQKAQQLKAVIVSDMASASARALIGGEPFWANRKSDEASVRDTWAVESLELDTRLRDYFGGPIVSAWEVYTWLVNRYDNGDGGQPENALITATHAPINLDPGASDAIAEALATSDQMVRRGPQFTGSPQLTAESQALHRLRVDLLSRIRGHLSKSVRNYESSHEGSAVPPPLSSPGRWFHPNVAEFDLLRLQAEIAREISQAHIAGYSTSGHDLLHDLIP